MTDKQRAEVEQLMVQGHSPLSAARCMANIPYREIEEEFGTVPHPADIFSPALRHWWNQQPWIWRPDNKNPIEASWERIRA